MTRRIRLTSIAALSAMCTISASYGASTAQSSAFGEYVKLDIAPLLGSPIRVTSGPLPSTSGSAPPTYSGSNQVASVTVSSGLLATFLQTGVLTVHAASGLPNSSSVAADAEVDNARSTVAALLGLTADVVRSNVNISGACPTLNATGTTTLVNAKLAGLLGLNLAVNPAPNTVILELLNIRVVLNEQIVTGNGTSNQGLTVNAIHISLNKAPLNLGLVSGDIIISQSQASMQCGPSNADLSLTKTASPSTVNVGDDVTYTLQALNQGPDAATNVVVSDTLPAQLTLVSSTASQGTCSGTTTVTCSLGSLASGATGTVTIVAKAVSGTSVTNTATITSDIPDSNGSDNSSSVTTSIHTPPPPAADLALTMSAPASVKVGDNYTYTVQVVNNGPNSASNVVVTDALPVGFVSSGASQGSCAGTSTVTCNLGTLASGATATINIVATASGTSAVNSANVTSSTNDSNTANNSASASTTFVQPSADLSLTMSAPGSVNVGDNYTYVLQVVNNGPGSSANVVITDSLPVPFVSASTSQGSCSGSSTVTCSLGTLASGAAATINIVAKASGTSAVNSASATASTTDSNSANNSASVTTTFVQPNADLALTMSAPGTVTAGNNYTYTIQVVNNGPNSASSVVVTDTLPVGFVSASTSQGSCSGTSTVMCNIGSLASGASATINIVATASGNSAVNTANVTSSTNDSNTANNNASANTTFIQPSADLAIAASGPAPRTVSVDSTFDYVLDVVNHGPQSAANVVVTDTLPLDFVSSSSSQGACTGTTTVTCNLGILASGATARVIISVKARGDVAANTASVTSSTADSNTANNTATISTIFR